MQSDWSNRVPSPGIGAAGVAPASGLPVPSDATGMAADWAWAWRLLGQTPASNASYASPVAPGAATPAAGGAPITPAPLVAATSAPAPIAAAPIAVSDGAAPVAVARARSAAAAKLPLRRVVATGTARVAAFPSLTDGVHVARGQSSYRQVVQKGGPGGRTIAIPVPGERGAAKVEVFAVQPYVAGGHRTQVLVPVTGTRVTIPAGSSVTFVVRVTGRTAGRASVDAGVGRIPVQVADRDVQALPMLTWVNAASATKRGASVAAVERVLGGFGVASSGAAGSAAPRRYLSAAWEAGQRQPVGPVADRIAAAERELASTGTAPELWVQVSDEQDTTPEAAARTATWIAALRRELAARGSHAKLFVACQPRAHTMAYAPHVDGWAVTQSAAGQTRDASIRAVQAAAARTGRPIELMEYPGNAFLDAQTPGSAALSTASAALDGASSWFLYSANNLDVLERGSGDEGRGDIGGLVAIRDGSVLPTLALAEAHYGANLGAAARSAGGAARTGPAADAVRAQAAKLDAYQHGDAPDLASWERSIAAGLL